MLAPDEGRVARGHRGGLASPGLGGGRHAGDEPDGSVDVYVRPGDVRLADKEPGIPARIESVQRTGPTVRAVAFAGETPIAIALPHLHHDVARVVPGAEVRLRLMQFSVYARGDRPNETVEEPVLIGRERERMIATTDPPPIDPASTELAPEEPPPDDPGTQSGPAVGSQGDSAAPAGSELAPRLNSAAQAESEPESRLGPGPYHSHRATTVTQSG